MADPKQAEQPQEPSWLDKFSVPQRFLSEGGGEALSDYRDLSDKGLEGPALDAASQARTAARERAKKAADVLRQKEEFDANRKVEIAKVARAGLSPEESKAALAAIPTAPATGQAATQSEFGDLPEPQSIAPNQQQQPGVQFARGEQVQLELPQPRLAGYQGYGDLGRKSARNTQQMQSDIGEAGQLYDVSAGQRRAAVDTAAEAEAERIGATKQAWEQNAIDVDNQAQEEREAEDLRQVALVEAKESLNLAHEDVRTNPPVEDRRPIALKIGAAIAMGLGAFGSALTKTPNFAMQIINDGIEQDLAEQRSALGEKKDAVSGQRNQLADLMREHGDSRKAEMVERSRMLEMAKVRVEQAGAAGMDQQAEANRQQMHAAITEQQAGIEAEMGKLNFDAANQGIADQMRARQGSNQLAGMQNRDTVGMMSAQAKAIGGSRKTAVPGTRPTGEVELTPQQAGKLRTERADAGKVLGMLTDLKRGVESKGYEFFDSMGAVRQKTLATMLKTQMKKVAGLGVMSESDSELLESIISSDPSSIFRQDRVRAQVEALTRIVSEGWKVTAKGNGLEEMEYGSVEGLEP